MAGGHGGHGGPGDAAGLPEEHEEHVNHEAWVIPYADLLTLLMAVFIALFAMSSVDVDKFRELALGFNHELGGDELDTGIFAPARSTGPIDGLGHGAPARSGGMLGPAGAPVPDEGLSALERIEADLDRARRAERAALAEVRDRIAHEAAVRGLAGFLDLRLEARGLVVSVVTDRVLFASGSSVLEPTGVQILRLVGEALAPLPNPLVVEGHTDDEPISTTRFPSNWELSTARAGAVVRYLTDTLGIAPARLTAAGYADQRPLADNGTAEGRAANRRVELVVRATAADDAVAALATVAPSEVTTGAVAPLGDPIPDIAP